MGLPVQLFTILILVTLPIVFVQFYSADSYALMSEDEKVEALFEKITLSEPNNLIHEDLAHEPIEPTMEKSEVAILQNEPSFIEGNFIEGEMTDDMEDIVSYTTDKQIETDTESAIITPLTKQKKVRLVKGKRHTQGMDFLSVLLMLKDKQR
jgi:ribosomal protein S13